MNKRIIHTEPNPQVEYSKAKLAQDAVARADADKRQEIAMVNRKKLLQQLPSTSEELWHAIKTIYNFEIPYKATAEGYHSPFEYVSSLFFERGPEDSVALANRNSGKTLIMAMVSDMKARSFPDYELLHAASTKTQAAVVSNYLHSFYKKPYLRPYFEKRPSTLSARWKNGSQWNIVAGNAKSISGQHPITLSVDEIEFWERKDIEQSLEVPASRGNYRRQLTAFSTRQRSFGAMTWLVEEGPKRGFKFFQWTVFEIMRPCTHCEAIDREPYGTDEARENVCVLWEACRGIRAKLSRGWLSLEDARRRCVRLGGPRGREWQTQGLCLRPSSHGLVLHNFEHAYKPNGNYTSWRYMPELPYYAIHDPAEGKRSVLYYAQYYNGETYVFDELVQDQCADVTETKKEFYERNLRLGYRDPEIVVVDPHRTDAVATWKAGTSTGEGISRRYNADTPDISQSTGTGQLIHTTLDMLRHSIRDGSGCRRLFINPEACPKCIRATQEYHYPINSVTNEVDSDTPSKAYSDEIDPLRYWEMYRITKLTRSGISIAII